MKIMKTTLIQKSILRQGFISMTTKIRLRCPSGCPQGLQGPLPLLQTRRVGSKTSPQGGQGAAQDQATSGVCYNLQFSVVVCFGCLYPPPSISNTFSKNQVLNILPFLITLPDHSGRIWTSPDFLLVIATETPPPRSWPPTVRWLPVVSWPPIVNWLSSCPQRMALEGNWPLVLVKVVSFFPLSFRLYGKLASIFVLFELAATVFKVASEMSLRKKFQFDGSKPMKSIKRCECDGIHPQCL